MSTDEWVKNSDGTPGYAINLWIDKPRYKCKPYKKLTALNNKAKKQNICNRVFINPDSDIFDNKAPQEWRDEFWNFVEATPFIDYILVTKRIGNAKNMIPANWFDNGYPANVWQLITACNQAEADRDIPKLLELPFAVRGLSIEPMLGEIDLSCFLGYNTHFNKGVYNETAARKSTLQLSKKWRMGNFRRRSDFFKNKIRLERYISQTSSRLYSSKKNGERGSFRNWSAQACLDAPQRGYSRWGNYKSQKRNKKRQQNTKPRAGNVFRESATRYVCFGTWENRPEWRKKLDVQSSVIPSRGNKKTKKRRCFFKRYSAKVQHFISACIKDMQVTTAVNFVITGGESGKNARPINPDWVRSIRNQCINANVPFFFKQWGEWADSESANIVLSEIAKLEHHIFEIGIAPVYKVGKQRAGNLLDGKAWQQMPYCKF